VDAGAMGVGAGGVGRVARKTSRRVHTQQSSEDDKMARAAECACGSRPGTDTALILKH
jgi:hypothetical protein